MLKLLKFLIASALFVSVAFSIYKVNNRLKNDSMAEKIILSSFHSSKATFNSRKSANVNLSKEDFNLIDNISLFIEDNKISSKDGILCKNNRFYFKMTDFENSLDYSMNIRNYDLTFYAGYTHDDYDFLHAPLSYDGTQYISMIDLTERLGLISTFDYENKSLHFYKLRKELSQENRKQHKKPALIRFEDVTAGPYYKSSEDLQKMRIMSDLMHSKNIPFHIAWIPRYKKPSSNIDNDLLRVYSLSNVDFIYTLDYMIAKGGLVGLHGYTHQYGSEESGAGFEFGYKSYFTKDYTHNRVESAINTAKALDIPFNFFESSHYASSKDQQAVFENYFDYVFEPAKYQFNTIPVLSRGNNKTIYVPTPLGYVHGNSAEEMIRRIETKPKDHIASFFYHPYIEFNYIRLINKNGYPEYDYSNSSILKQLIKCLDSEGYSPVKITDIKIS